MAAEELPLTLFFEDLRKRLILAGTCWLAAFLACYAVAERLFGYIAHPLKAILPQKSSLVFLTAVEPFFTYLKVAAMAGLLLCLPLILWQLWGLAARALNIAEQGLGLAFVLSGCLCFYSGAYLGFTYVFPLIFSVLIDFGIGSGSAQAMLSMDAYLSLTLMLLLAFGLVFELPILLTLLARLGLVDHRWLRKHRKYMLIVAFLFGALFTPGPDVLSQCALAIPFVVLYEVGILGARALGRSRGAPVENHREESPASL
ncbi:twin-arginine translocase subunit TatC [Geoalkalibacter sp.]|uniref:twin-arginine translocase subunit TatC n=1 Tax=Geoalkalibacter sp. TaxID=3041440 RepID=UPI00272ED691|nr:twin-arginine translocase subunit TatC [Geoalkalibacter sp.]